MAYGWKIRTTTDRGQRLWNVRNPDPDTACRLAGEAAGIGVKKIEPLWEIPLEQESKLALQEDEVREIVALKRPTDIIARGKLIGDILTGQLEDVAPEKPIDPALEYARKGGLKGGKARAESMTPERRAEIAKKAAAKRWSKA
ncbi:MAG TPA: hypothetical protein VHU23_02180 [Rhizomicrobium sp.]|jgi:hypothetical protein|nr:hypothetical protein [Rhizomicrobium sp.]